MALHRVLYQSILNAKLTGRKKLDRKRCTSNRDDHKLENTVKQSWFKHLGESFIRSELKLEWVHQESPHSGIFRKRATKPLGIPFYWSYVIFCNTKPAEGALTRVLTVLHSLYFYTHFLFVAFISMLAIWACAKYCQFTCLTERYFLIFSAWLLCMILPSSLFIDYLDYPPCFGYLIGLMFLLRPIACLLTLAFWISLLYVDRSDCYFVLTLCLPSRMCVW